MRYFSFVLVFCMLFLCLCACEREQPQVTQSATVCTQPTTAPTETTAPLGTLPAPSLPAETRKEVEGCRLITVGVGTFDKNGNLTADSPVTIAVPEQKIPHEDPVPVDIGIIYESPQYQAAYQKAGIHYESRWEFARSGYNFEKSIVEKYDADVLVWSAEITEFMVSGIRPFSDGILVWGEPQRKSTTDPSYTCIAKLDLNGNLLWLQTREGLFEQETIQEIYQNDDGSYTVFSTCDRFYGCISQYTSDGECVFSRRNPDYKRSIGGYQQSGDGYLAQCARKYKRFIHVLRYNEIAKLDRSGYLTDVFAYSQPGMVYSFEDYTQYNGKLYISANVVALNDPNQTPERQEVSSVIRYLFSENPIGIPSAALVPMLRECYTAVLLICDMETGIPSACYSIDGSMAGDFGLDDQGNLMWDVHSFIAAGYSPYTSAGTIGGVQCVYRYTFDSSARMIAWEKTDRLIHYLR